MLVELVAGKTLLITQFCREGGDFGPKLTGSVFGRIPSGGTGACTTYEPGIRLSGPQTISCTLDFANDFSLQSCLITGYCSGGRAD